MNQAFVPQPPQRAPIFNVPIVIIAVVVVMAAIHGIRALLPSGADLECLREFAYVPGRLLSILDAKAEIAHLATLMRAPGGTDQLAAARFFLADRALMPWTPLTYAFLHANLTHLLLNMLWFVAFGAPVARRFGAARFLLFLAVTTVCGALAHTIARPFDFEPVIGASAAVSGAVAAAIRFVFQPGESLGPRRDALYQGFGVPAPVPVVSPPVPLRAILRDRQVLSFLCVWFVLNFLFGVLSQPLGFTDQSVAWEAHVGGFLAGLFLFSLFDPKFSPKPSRPVTLS